MTTPANSPKFRVVILGGGFGGLECCRRLADRPDLEITLVDRQNHHLFQPLLYQVATAGLAAPDIAQPTRAILSDQDNAQVLMEEVQSIDLAQNSVSTPDRKLPYDYLVIALGVQTGYFGHDEWAQYCIGLKSLADATTLRANILHAFEKAEAAETPSDSSRLLTFVVVGGGPTGVEIAGSLAELSKKALRGNFRNIDPSKTKIILLEANSRLLHTFPEHLGEYAKAKLGEMGVEVMLNARVEEVGEGFVRVPSVTIDTDNIIWAAGVEAPPLTRTLGCELDHAGRIKVQNDLSIPGQSNAFAIGDISHLVDANNMAVPALAPAAIQMGRHVSTIILNETRLMRSGHSDRSLPRLRGDFKYRDKGTMATIGRSAAVASTLGTTMTGLTAWVMWLLIHLILLVGLRNRLVVLLNWIFAYVRYNPGARIITSTRPEPPPSRHDHTY
ncbi:MAG: NAD(P)/FAD-dependent oxidoreductase [Verrucomicrobiota bacterium]